MAGSSDDAGRFSLATAPLRVRLTVLRVCTNPQLAKRLGALGVRPGAPVEVLHGVSGGGRMISVAGSRLVLDRAVMRAIRVDEQGRDDEVNR
ncbi:MAG TPA: ferrous iron transport protein A [Propionibacterium sp.]|nr:ferrous iron transport protein A [Propionibacterium sp.]